MSEKISREATTTVTIGWWSALKAVEKMTREAGDFKDRFCLEDAERLELYASRIRIAIGIPRQEDVDRFVSQQERETMAMNHLMAVERISIAENLVQRLYDDFDQGQTGVCKTPCSHHRCTYVREIVHDARKLLNSTWPFMAGGKYAPATS